MVVSYHNKNVQIWLFFLGGAQNFLNDLVYTYIYIQIHTRVYIYIYMCVCVCVCVCATDNMRHKVDFNWIEYRVFLLQIDCRTKTKELCLSALLFIHSYVSPSGTKWNANSLVQHLNSDHTHPFPKTIAVTPRTYSHYIFNITHKISTPQPFF